MENISDQTKEFVEIFKPFVKEEIIPWIGTDAVGLSVLRNYPKGGKFIPAKNKRGEDDSVALIKIGYLLAQENSEHKNDKKLFLSVSKASRFLLKGNFDFIFDKDNDDSPTEASLKESKGSLQPIDLEESKRYEFNINTKKIKDLEERKNVTPAHVVDEIYDLHLKTLSYSASFFRIKMWIQKVTVNSIGPITDGLKFLNFQLFGRTMRKTDNFALGIFDTYSFADLIDSTTEKIKIFGSDFPITNQTARTFILVILIVFLINYFYDYDVLGFVNLSQKATGNPLFQASLIGSLLIFFDKILPYLVLVIINFLIKFNLWLMRIKIKFS